MGDEPQLPSDIVLLAPVPYQHLVSGLITCEREGKVAFGTNSTAPLELEVNLKGGSCPVLIFASETPFAGPPRVSWAAQFIRCSHAKRGRHEHGETYRPATTVTDGDWALFWEVSDLHPLTGEDALPISSLRPAGKKTKYAKIFVPHGPLLIDTPY